MQKMTSKLKPCPFCGSKNINDTTVNSYLDEHKYGNAVCPDCSAVAPFSDNQISAWNTRAPIEITDEMVERAACNLYADTVKHNGNGGKMPWERLISSMPDTADEYRRKAKAALEAALNNKNNK